MVMDKVYSYSIHGNRYWDWSLKMLLGIILAPVAIVLQAFGVAFDL